MNEISINTTPNSVNKFVSMISAAKETYSVIQALSATENKTARALVAEQILKHKYQLGQILGTLKANLDCLPEDIAISQKVNGIPLNFLIKMKVDEYVLDIREVSEKQEMTTATEYEKKYRSLSECICGYGYNTDFNEERFKAFFPRGTHMFVLGFAEGYSDTFHQIAASESVTTDYTDPKTQDIWKNWEFFLKREVYEYRIDGKFLFISEDTSFNNATQTGYNLLSVNQSVYKKLKARDDSKFTESSFDFSF